MCAFTETEIEFIAIIEVFSLNKINICTSKKGFNLLKVKLKFVCSTVIQIGVKLLYPNRVKGGLISQGILILVLLPKNGAKSLH